MKPNWRWIWGGLLVAGLIAEGIALANKDDDDTLSDAVWDINHPMLAFAVGVICGHWFWPKRTETTISVVATATTDQS